MDSSGLKSSNSSKKIFSNEVFEYEISQEHEGLKRKMTSRHLFMISIGSAVGMGLWLGTGASLHKGGPVGLFVGFLITGSVAWALNMSIGEIASLYPVTSAFPRWSAQFIDPSISVVVGWMHWWGNMIGASNELVGMATVMSFWLPNVSPGVWISVFFVLLVLMHSFAVDIFAEVESLLSGIKFSWVFIAIIVMIIISAGGAPKGDPIGFRYWTSAPFNENGFKGFLTVLPTCVFSLAGIEIVGLVAAECISPRKSVPIAVKSIWLRITLFYILGSFVVTIVMSPNNDQLLGGSGTNASPFVIAFNNSGLPGLAHAMNAIILISVFSSASGTFYGCPRILMGLAHLNMAPKIFSRVSRRGVPYVGYAISAILSGGLAYINLSESGAVVFGWFLNLSSLVALLLWSVIFVVNIRLRKAWIVQGKDMSNLPWKTNLNPYIAWYGLFWSILIVIIEFYLSVWPWKEQSSAKNFFANYISVVLMIIIYIGSKFYFKGPLLIPLNEIDLDSGVFVEDDVINAEKTFDSGIFRGFYSDSKRFISNLKGI